MAARERIESRQADPDQRRRAIAAMGEAHPASPPRSHDIRLQAEP
jgi:hypothetical protein